MENIQHYSSMEEIWKKVKGYGDKYEISSFGRVSNGVRILINQIDIYGYAYTTFTHLGKSKKFKIHRLIAEYFIPNPDNLPCVNHKNEVRSDNSIKNLEWCTVEYNNRYSKGIKVVVFYKDQLFTFDSSLQASEELNVTQDEVYRLARNTTYLLGCLNYILTNGVTLPKVSLSANIEKGINLKDGKYVVRVTHGGVRNYVGAYSTKEEAIRAKQEYVNLHCPITEYPTEEPNLDSIYKLLATLK